MLYGLGYNSTVTPRTLQLYAISSISGIATAVGTTGTFVNSSQAVVSIGTDSFTRFDMDFNPTVDRIRVVTGDGPSGAQNFRINPNTGAFIDGDSVTSGTNMDSPINGGTTTVQGTAYTNSQQNSSVTSQYTIDATTDSLYIQNPPNAGTQTNALPLGDNAIAIRGFDIPVGVNVTTSSSLAVGQGVAVIEYASNSQQLLTQVNLSTGALSGATRIGAGDLEVKSMALQSSTTAPVVALASGGGSLFRFNVASATTGTSVTVSGVDASEVLVGLDVRPATGELMALGVNATADTGTLYRLDPQSGAATTIGTTGSIAFVDSNAAAVDFPSAGTGYGFNFNPTVDRIRVVTCSGLNFRINPNTGAPVDGSDSVTGVNTDTALNGASTSGHGTAYTNSFPQVSGQAIASQYTLDATTRQLLLQAPPNSGVLASALPVRLGGQSLIFSSVTGFDIPPETRATATNTAVSTGIAFAALTVSGVTSLYSIDLPTGNATLVSGIGDGTIQIAGLAVGQTAID
jgi:hypothetical protein